MRLHSISRTTIVASSLIFCVFLASRVGAQAEAPAPAAQQAAQQAAQRAAQQAGTDAPAEAAAAAEAPAEVVREPVAAPSAVAPPSDQPMMWVEYEGELLDASNAPISGVFPLVFSLYRSPDSREPIWVELQWVSVVEGRYDIHLGRTSGVPLTWNGEIRTLGVALNGGGELTRHPIVLTEWRDEIELLGARITAAGEVDLAGRAISADRAAYALECATLSGRSPSQLNRFAELLARVEEMRGRLNRSGANRIGRDTVTLSVVGAASGRPYQRSCPPGFALTGIRGGMGQLVDGFRGVCTEVR